MLRLAAFITTALFVPGLPDGWDAPRWWAIAILGPLAAVTANRRPSGIGLWLGVLSCLAAIVTMFWTVDIDATAGALLKMLGLAGVFYAAYCTDDLTDAWTGFACGIAIWTPLALAQVFGLTSFSDPLGGMTGTMLNRDVLAAVGAVGFVGLFASRAYLTSKWFAPLLIACGLCAVLPESRGAFLALTSVLFVVTFAVIAWPYRFALVASAFVVVIAALAWDAQSVPRLATMMWRLSMWEEVIRNLSLIGWGYGAFASAFGWEHAHNDGLELIAELGVFATVPFALIVYALGAKTNVAERLALLVAIVASAVSYQLHEPATALAAALCLGRCCGSRDGVVDRRPSFIDRDIDHAPLRA